MSSKNQGQAKGDDDDEGVSEVKYQWRAIASSKSTQFQANLSEINYELIKLEAGYYLRLETSN